MVTIQSNCIIIPTETEIIDVKNSSCMFILGFNPFYDSILAIPDEVKHIPEPLGQPLCIDLDIFDNVTKGRISKNREMVVYQFNSGTPSIDVELIIKTDYPRIQGTSYISGSLRQSENSIQHRLIDKPYDHLYIVVKEMRECYFLFISIWNKEHVISSTLELTRS